jgi:sigma-54 dependent transcriptional regulator, acetoin dehydrogenase operon transcriptional activator AcoR
MIEPTFSYKSWKRFVNEGVLDSSRLNKRIIESWHRCKNSYVDPNLGIGLNILKKDRLQSQREKNSLLYEVALPHFHQLDESMSALGMMALLIDSEGYVLSLKGDREAIQNARKINFVEGVRWTEEDVGTNAIGTTLKAGEAIMVTGTEHFSIASHHWSCSAVPIHNQEGTLIGVIDISSPLDRAQPIMLGVAASVAYSIERDLYRRHYEDEADLVYGTLDLIETDQPLIICNLRQKVVCASKPIRKNYPIWLGKMADEIGEFGFSIQMKAPVYSKKHGGLIGFCVYLNESVRKETKIHFFSPSSEAAFRFKGEKGTSQLFQRTLEEVKHVAATKANVYIHGETGTGKEVIAQTIHENSLQKNGPFIAVNCGAIPRELMESELFGYAEGAFTGAKRQGYKGKFEQANHGTIFLDEIGEISPSTQVALLRVLQERKVTPVGGTNEIPLDIRFITATHRDLRQLVKEGRFREDLYYRLHVFPITVPSLRERKEDIPHFIRYFCQKNHWDLEFSPAFIEKLIKYEWPGNIRELFNVLERMLILSGNGRLVDPALVFSWSTPIQESSLVGDKLEEEHPTSAALLTTRQKIQKQLMIEALHNAKGNVSLAANLMGVPRSTFYKRMQKFNL